MMVSRKKYPGIAEAEEERIRAAERNKPDEQPDFLGGAPNYEKFKGMTPELVLVRLNID